MSQTATVDPRAEAVAASRHRSGSIKLESNLDPQLPLAPPTTSGGGGGAGGSVPSSSAEGGVVGSQFLSIRGKFEDTSGGISPRGGGAAFGSHVSKIKERFQHGRVSGSREDHQPPPGLSHSLSGRDGRAASSSGDRSPESKRKKIGTAESGHPLAPALDPKRRTSSVDTAPGGPGYAHGYHHPVLTPPMSPPLKSPTKVGSAFPLPPSQTHSSSHHEPTNRTKSRGAGLSDVLPPPDAVVPEASTHVQRFNYTRALFARMEEESRRQLEKEKVQKRILSPSRFTSNTPSPILSPTATSPVQESKRFPSGTSSSASSPRRPSPSKADITASFTAGVAAAPPTSSNTGEVPRRSRGRENRHRHSSFELGSGDEVSREETQDKPRPVSSGDEEGDVDVAQLLRSRRIARGQLSRDSSVEDRSGKVYSGTASAAAPTGQGSSSTDPFAALQESLESPAISNGLDHQSDDKPDASNTPAGESEEGGEVSPSPPPYLPPSSRLEHSSRPAQRFRDQGLSSSSSSPAAVSSSSPSSAHSEILPATATSKSNQAPAKPPTEAQRGVVTRRPRIPLPPGTSPEEESKKRLSKEEIEAALERADSYLATLSSPDDEKAEISEKRERESRRSQTHAESAAARRKFLYGDEGSTPSPSESKEAVVEPELVADTTSSVSSAPVVTASDYAAQATAFVDLLQSGPAESSDDVPSQDAETQDTMTRDTPPPSYHESTTEVLPPPYHEATATILLASGDKVSSPSRPVPIPRRAAPPPPSSKAPMDGAGPPPPAPEPGSSEYEKLQTVGNRNAIILDHSYADDLVLPEEQMSSHSE